MQPKSSRNEVRVEPDGRIKIYVTAPPVDGAANAAVCAVLAKSLGVGKSAVRIARGESGRDKVVTVNGVSEEFVMQRLGASSHPTSD